MKNQKNLVLWTPLIAILLLFTIDASKAQNLDKATADSQYDIADKAYGNGSCMPAYDAANRAFTLYTRANDEAGILKARDLLGKITSCLKTSADKKYTIATKFLANYSYNMSISWCNDAKIEYAAIQDNAGIEGCDQVIAEARKHLLESGVDAAEKTLREGNDLFEKGDYLHAKEKANAALQMYTVMGYQDGMIQANALISAIESAIIKLRNDAETSLTEAINKYNKARQTQAFDDYIESKTLAAKAKDLFAQIGDNPRYSDAQEIIKGCDYEISQLEGRYKTTADAKFEDCRTQYLFGKGTLDRDLKRIYFNNATTLCQASETIYGQLWSWARETSNFDKQRTYESEINKVKTERDKIKNENDNIETEQKAEEFFKDANRLYTNGECQNASLSATQAKSLFEKIGNYPGVYKSRTLVDQITDCLNKMTLAEQYVKTMNESYKMADYSNASAELDKAQKIFAEINNKGGLTRSEDYKKMIVQGYESKLSADKMVNQSLLDFAGFRFQEAAKGAGDARAIYTKIGYVNGMNLTDSLLKNITLENEKRRKGGDQNMMVIMGTFVVGILAVVGWWLFNRAQKERREKQKLALEKKKLEEEIRRKRDEEHRREERHIKELEAERNKLKSMVAEEMRRMEMAKRGKP